MDQQLLDWIDFCEGRKDFEESHFYTLFFEGEAENGRRSATELKIIFSYCNASELLFQRFNNVMSDDVEEDIIHYQEYLLNNIKLEIDQRIKIVNQEQDQELLSLMQNSIRYIDNVSDVRESQENDWPYSEILSMTGHYFRDRINERKDIFYALKEAFYGFTTNPSLTWYLLLPLIDTDINLDYYYNIWKVGGDYSVTEDEIIISRYLPEKE